MNRDLALTPTGRLVLWERDDEDTGTPDAWLKRVAAAFAQSQPAGIFSLAASRPDTPPPPSLAYWREFACRYLTELCRTPQCNGDAFLQTEPPSEADLGTMLLAAPPMQGGEYLNTHVIRSLWDDLDAWVRDEIAGVQDGLTGWLRKHAPMWHQVGRVCFHLAENKRDPETPFAFLATYAPRLSKGGRVQYQPLGQALQEYAGERNRKALVSLLSPVQRAAEKVDFVRELVDSGDVFHALAWTPGEAYRLLKSVPLLEESGLPVRLPDWWRKRITPQAVTKLRMKLGMSRSGSPDCSV